MHAKNVKLRLELETLQMRLTCGICYENEKKLVMSCDHSICANCWKRLPEPKKCPFDRRLVSIKGKLYL